MNSAADREHRLVAAADEAGARLDQFLARRLPGLSRSRLQGLIASGRCTVDGRPAKSGRRLAAGADVRLTVPAPESPGLIAEAIPLDIIYEDADLLVINKPRGLVVHPAAGHRQGTLVNALLAHLAGTDFIGVGGQGRPGIVHRLDQDTTGLLVIAKTDLAHQSLAAQFAGRTAVRQYLAIVHGTPAAPRGRIEAPIGRDPRHRQRMAVHPRGGRFAVTHFYVAESLGQFSLLCCRLETGRTHQIRVHLAYIGHPVAGDAVYGPRRRALGLQAQALHARRLVLRHPRSGAEAEFKAPLPAEMAGVLAWLRGEGGDSP